MLVTLLLLQALEGNPPAPPSRLPGTVQTFLQAVFAQWDPVPKTLISLPVTPPFTVWILWPVLSLPCGVFCYLATVLGELLPRLAGRGS